MLAACSRMESSNERGFRCGRHRGADCLLQIDADVALRRGEAAGEGTWRRNELCGPGRSGNEVPTLTYKSLAPMFRTCGCRVFDMAQYRISEAAGLLGVSDDTVRRWVDAGSLTVSKDGVGRSVLDGAELAGFAQRQAHAAGDPSGVGRSARNQFVGLVTSILTDTVMAQVEIQCGPHRVVSLMSSEAVRDLELEVGSLAVAVVKATTVIVETPKGRS